MSSRQERIRQLETSLDIRLAELRGHVMTLKIQKETALDEVDRIQRFVIKKDRQIEAINQEIEDVQLHYQVRVRRELERVEVDQRLSSLGRGRTIASSQREDGDFRIVLQAPSSTPSIRCFMVHPIEVENHHVDECHFFLSLTNEERVALLIKQHRCFGCFMPSAVVDHEVGNCPHPKRCNKCQSQEHHQILCGSKKLYEDLLAAGGSRRYL